MKSIDGNADPNDSTYSAIIRAKSERIRPPYGQEDELSNFAMIKLQSEKLQKQSEQKKTQVRS